MKHFLLLICVIAMATFAAACTNNHSSSESTIATTEAYIEQPITVSEREPPTTQPSTPPTEIEHPTQEPTTWDKEAEQELKNHWNIKASRNTTKEITLHVRSAIHV